MWGWGAGGRHWLRVDKGWGWRWGRAGVWLGPEVLFRLASPLAWYHGSHVAVWQRPVCIVPQSYSVHIRRKLKTIQGWRIDESKWHFNRLCREREQNTSCCHWKMRRERERQGVWNKIHTSSTRTSDEDLNQRANLLICCTLTGRSRAATEYQDLEECSGQLTGFSAVGCQSKASWRCTCQMELKT